MMFRVALFTVPPRQTDVLDVFAPRLQVSREEAGARYIHRK